MNGDKFLHKYQADQLQKQLDEDMVEMMKDEQKQYAQNGGRAPQRNTDLPQGDVFEWKRHQQMLRTQERKLMEREADPRNRRGT